MIASLAVTLPSRYRGDALEVEGDTLRRRSGLGRLVEIVGRLKVHPELR